MAGRATGDPSWLPDEDFLSACDREPGELRIGRFDQPVIADAEVDPEVLHVYEDTSRLLEGLGHVVEDIDVPLPREAVATFETCWAVLTAMSTTMLPPDAPMRPLTRWLGDRGAMVSGPEFGVALGELRRVAARVLHKIASYDVILTPTLAVPPLPVGALRNDDDPAADFEAQKRFTPWTSLWNVTGSPAISLPLGQSPTGLPIGMMLAARPGDEATLLAVSAQVEAAALWRERTSPVW
jgi:amidase